MWMIAALIPCPFAKRKMIEVEGDSKRRYVPASTLAGREMSSFNRVLILETSGKVGQVALASGETILGRRELPEARRHARDLAERCRELFAEQNWRARELSAVVVSIGPGSFTGLRVGIASAKAMAYATGCELFGVPAFDAIVACLDESAPAVEIIADALQGQVYSQRFIPDAGSGWRPSEPIGIRSFEDWLRDLTPGSLVAGPAIGMYESRLPETARIVRDEDLNPRIEGLLRRARGDSASTQSNAWTLEPIYLRGSSAEEKRNRA
jgi:tRNA threonylcarbamoyladenosine biosynthesis protein TsaB